MQLSGDGIAFTLDSSWGAAHIRSRLLGRFNVYNLLALMMKNNVVEIDWDDEILAQTVLTHAGKNMADGQADNKTARADKGH